MMRFELVRDEDATGVSGAGHVATGCMFRDGTCAMRWLTTVPSTAVYACLADVFHIHGHEGRTRVVPESGFVACSASQAGFEAAWSHEVDGRWCVDVVSYHKDSGMKVERLTVARDEEGSHRHAASYIATGYMECGGEMHLSHDLDQPNG